MKQFENISRFSVSQRQIFSSCFFKAKQCPNIKILRFDESLYACNAPFFKKRFYELIGIELRQTPLIRSKQVLSMPPQAEQFKFVILDCSPFNFIDTVGVKLLIEVCATFCFLWFLFVSKTFSIQIDLQRSTETPCPILLERMSMFVD